VHNNSKAKFLSLSVTQDFQYAGVAFLPLLRVTLSPFDVSQELTIASRLYAMAQFVQRLHSEANATV
jgi:hypothetical protein